MNRRALLASLAGGFATLYTPAARPEKLHRLGALFLRSSCPTRFPEQWNVGNVLKRLAELGYVEGRNLVIDAPCVRAGSPQLPQLASELVGLRPDALLSAGTAATRALQDATRTIPIVTLMEDPVTSGFARSLVRPGGNVTGLTLSHPDTQPKQLELFRTIVPKLDRLVIIGNVGYTGSREILRPYESASKAAGVVPDMQIVDYTAFERVFSEMKGSGVRAALIALGQFGIPDLGPVAKLAIRHGVATMSNRSGYVEHGGLMSFDMHHEHLQLRWSSIIDKIFRGIKAAEIPWELPDRSRFAINLRTAKLLGLSIPAELLLRADRVIE